MPSYHDSPIVCSSSSSLVSRHDAGSRSVEGGAAEQLSEEADEPPNKSAFIIKNTSNVSASEIDSSDSERDDADCGGNEADVDDDVQGFIRTRSAGNNNSSKSSPRNLLAQSELAVTDVDGSSSSSSSDVDDVEASSDDGGGQSPIFLPALDPMKAGTGYALPAGYDPSHPCEELPPAGVSVSFVSPKLEARTSNTGSGIFAIEQIFAGDVLIVWTGRILSAEQTLSIMGTPDKHYILQIGDGFYQTPLQPNREPADWTNHSCSPNAGFGKQSPICLSAMKNIDIGEEVTFDYAMCETDERLWEPMECMCGSSQCRGSITANDWKIHPQLWSRYEGFFSPHVQRKIDQMKNEAKIIAAADTEAPKPPQLSDSDTGTRDKQILNPANFGLFDQILWRFGIIRAVNLPRSIIA